MILGKLKGVKLIQLKVNESQYKQCGVTPYFSTGAKFTLRKDEYRQNIFHRAKSIERNIEKR